MFARMMFKSGLGLGVGLTYFLDPDKGHKRRDLVLRWSRSLGNLMAQGADRLIPGRVGTFAQRLLTNRNLTRGRAPGLVAVGLGGLAAGAGIAYFLDSKRGPERRARVERQVTGALHRTGGLFVRVPAVVEEEKKQPHKT